MQVVQGSCRVSAPVIHKHRLATVLHLIGCPVHSTPASVEMGLPTVGIHIPKPAAYSVERIKIESS